LSLFYGVILKLAHLHHDMGVKFPVDYIFDQQGSMGDDSVIWYKHIKSWQKPEMAALMGGNPRFEDDKTVLPLQAADMLAWHVRRRIDNPKDDESKWPTAPLADLTYAEAHLSKEYLVNMAEEMKLVSGLETVQQKPKDYSRSQFHKIINAIPPQGRRR